MSSRTTLHRDDFIEMLKRGDSVDYIAHAYGIEIRSLERRFFRFPRHLREEISHTREIPFGWKKKYPVYAHSQSR